jgi:NhaA family Na+:H+ antiporter
LKREVLEGELSSVTQVALPAAAALGGVLAPIGVFWFLNSGDPSAINGWAIPTATDIAFALGVLSLLGSRVPLELKLFLTAVAIVDDIVAIVIIAVFYTSDLSVTSLAIAGAGVGLLFVLNRLNVTRLGVYLFVGTLIWVAVLKSGVHATLAGVVVAMAIPLRAQDDRSPARHLEHMLHPWVAYLILPTFAFANAGVQLIGVNLEMVTGTVLLGIALGLFIGKQVGIFGLVWLAVKLGLAKLPNNCGWRQMYGAALLAGIGFTMSLFIGTLAFEHGDFGNITATRLGVLLGSLFSGLAGVGVLLMSGRAGEPEA